jgi:hypothetical protein
LITPAQIRQRVMQMMLSRQQRFIKTVPKEMRGEAMREIQE